MSKPKFRSVPIISSGQFTIPQAIAGGDDIQKPSFSLEHLEGDFCLLKCDKTEQANFIKKLHRISKQTWGDLRKLGRNNGFEPIPCNQLNCKVPADFSKEKAAIVFHMAGACMIRNPLGRVWMLYAIVFKLFIYQRTKIQQKSLPFIKKYRYL